VNEEGEREEEDEDVEEVGWPVKGPATPQQALIAIGLIFLLGLVLGFLLAKTF